MDPGLAALAGHHFDLDLRVARHLVNDGHEVVVHAHQQVLDAVVRGLEGVAPVKRLFRAFPYTRPAEFDPLAGEAMMHIHHCGVLAHDLAQVEPADLWLWPSIFATQLHACAIAAPKVPVAGCVQVPPASLHQPGGAAWWRQAFVAADKAGLPLRIGGMEPEHRYDFLPLTVDHRFTTFPCPFEGSPIAQPRAALRTVGFFGHQRTEKGDRLIPALIEKLLALGHQVVMQNSQGRRLFADHPRVTQLGHVAHIAEEIARCDLVILPYDPNQYRRKGSGILLEAMATGIPVIAPFDTAPGRWVERTGSGELFVSLTEADILKAFQAAAADYPRLSRAAFEAAQAWKQAHGMRRFVNAMVQG